MVGGAPGRFLTGWACVRIPSTRPSSAAFVRFAALLLRFVPLCSALFGCCPLGCSCACALAGAPLHTIRAMPGTSLITFDDFLRVDVRVGRIVDVRPFPRRAQARLPAEVDFGPELGRRRSRRSSPSVTQPTSCWPTGPGRRQFSAAPDRDVLFRGARAGCARRRRQRGARRAAGRSAAWRPTLLGGRVLFRGYSLLMVTT